MKADPITLISEFSRRINDIKLSRYQLNDELLNIEKSLAGLIDSIDTVHQHLKDIKTSPAAQKIPVPNINMSQDDFKIFIEKILQGSLEAAGDKLSGRIMNMLKELKGLAGAEREAKILEIKNAADNDMVDLSKLYTHLDVKSNLGEVGVEEKESKGIESSLEKIRKLRGKLKHGDTP